MPIEQMEVVDHAAARGSRSRRCPASRTSARCTSRGSAEINLFFNWNVDMLGDAPAGRRRGLARAEQPARDGADPDAPARISRAFPIIGYSLTSDTVPQKDLWELATYEIKPRLNSLPGVASVLIQGGQRPEFHVVVDPPRMLRAKTSIADIVSADQPHATSSTRRACSTATTSCSSASITGAGAQPGGHRRHRRQAREQRAGARPGRRRPSRPASNPSTPSVSANGKPALLAERQPAARQQHRAGRRRSAPGDGRDPADAAGRRRDAAVLRPVEHRPGVDRERARRDRHRPVPGRSDHLAVPARLGHRRDDRASSCR